MTDLLVCGDSITAYFYGWITQYGTYKGYTYNTPPFAVGGTPGTYDTPTSPAYGGSTLMNYPYPTATIPLAANFTARCGNYCHNTTVLILQPCINDLYAMALNASLASGAQANWDDWWNVWASINTSINALGANKPLRVIVLGCPVVSGVGIVRANMPPHMRGDWMTARAIMDKITANACTIYGWTFVTLRGMTLDMLVDARHPSTAGQAYYGNQLITVAG